MDNLNQSGAAPISSISDNDQSNQTVFDYPKVKQQLDILISEWESGGSIPEQESANTILNLFGEQRLAKIRRELRRDPIDVNTRRKAGELEPDENYIPQHVIDQHIFEEKPSQIGFIEQPDRLLVFKDLTDPNTPTGDIEEEFTNHMRYEGWLIPWHRAFDATDLHGGCCLEVVLDETKPFYSRLEYIRREDLIFPSEATDLQGCEYIMRRYWYMPFELEGFVKKFGFSEKEVADLCKDQKDRHKRIAVFKVYHKRDGIVYQFWYTIRGQTFLKDPEVYESGVFDLQECFQYSQMAAIVAQTAGAAMLDALPQPQSIPATDYPIFFLPYEVIEDDRLLASKGLAFRDKSDQEALTQLWTNIINASTRASQVYASYKQDPAGQVGLQDNAKISPNTINSRQVEFWSFPMPPPALIDVAQRYGSVAAAKSSRVDFAVNNRDDSGKTATEIQAASKQSSSLVSVGLSGQSKTIVDIYVLSWKIGISQVLLGNITTFSIPADRLLHTYRFGSAGDVDIRKREDKKQVIRETFQYVAGTPIGNKFMIYLIETFFPERAKEWVPMLQAGDPTQMIAMCIQLFEALLADPRFASIMKPEEHLQLQNAVNQMKAYVSTYTGGSPTGGPVSNRPQPMGEPPNNEIANNLPKEQVGKASGAVGDAG